MRCTDYETQFDFGPINFTHKNPLHNVLGEPIPFLALLTVVLHPAPSTELFERAPQPSIPPLF